MLRPGCESAFCVLVRLDPLLDPEVRNAVLSMADSIRLCEARIREHVLQTRVEKSRKRTILYPELLDHKGCTHYMFFTKTFTQAFTTGLILPRRAEVEIVVSRRNL